MRNKCVCVLSLLLAAAACQNQPRAVPDVSLLSRTPCAPPCWQGLVPGQTTMAAAMAFLRSSDLVGNNIGGVESNPPPSETYQEWWWAGDKRDKSKVNAFGFDGSQTLTRISLQLNSVISVGQVIRLYGIPTRLTLRATAPLDNFGSSGPKGIDASALFYADGFAVTWFEEAQVTGSPVRYCLSFAPALRSIEYYDQVRADMFLAQFQRAPDTRSVSLAGDEVFSLAAGEPAAACVNLPTPY